MSEAERGSSKTRVFSPGQQWPILDGALVLQDPYVAVQPPPDQHVGRRSLSQTERSEIYASAANHKLLIPMFDVPLDNDLPDILSKVYDEHGQAINELMLGLGVIFLIGGGVLALSHAGQAHAAEITPGGGHDLNPLGITSATCFDNGTLASLGANAGGANPENPAVNTRTFLYVQDRNEKVWIDSSTVSPNQKATTLNVSDLPDKQNNDRRELINGIIAHKGLLDSVTSETKIDLWACVGSDGIIREGSVINNLGGVDYYIDESGKMQVAPKVSGYGDLMWVDSGFNSIGRIDEKGNYLIYDQSGKSWYLTANGEKIQTPTPEPSPTPTILVPKPTNTRQPTLVPTEVKPTAVPPEVKLTGLIDGVDKLTDPGDRNLINQAILLNSENVHKPASSDLNPDFRTYWQQRWGKYVSLDKALSSISTDPSYILTGKQPVVGGKLLSEISLDPSAERTTWNVNGDGSIVLSSWYLHPTNWENPVAVTQLALLKEMIAVQAYPYFVLVAHMNAHDAGQAAENISFQIADSQHKSIVSQNDEQRYHTDLVDKDFSGLDWNGLSMADCCGIK